MSTPISIRLSDEDKKNFKDASEKKWAMSLAEFLRFGGETLAGFDNEFVKRIRTFSKNAGLPVHEILRRLAISWMARYEAKEEVFGLEAQEVHVELQVSPTGLPTEVLHENCKRGFMREYESQKEVILKAYPDPVK